MVNTTPSRRSLENVLDVADVVEQSSTGVAGRRAECRGRARRRCRRRWCAGSGPARSRRDPRRPAMSLPSRRRAKAPVTRFMASTSVPASTSCNASWSSSTGQMSVPPSSGRPEHIGDELGIGVELGAATCAGGDDADRLEVADVEAAVAQRHAEADGDGGLTATSLGRGDVDRSQHRPSRRATLRAGRRARLCARSEPAVGSDAPLRAP